MWAEKLCLLRYNQSCLRAGFALGAFDLLARFEKRQRCIERNPEEKISDVWPLLAPAVAAPHKKMKQATVRQSATQPCLMGTRNTATCP